MFLKIFSFLSILILFFQSFAVQKGLYDNINQPGMKLELKNGNYRLWIRYQNQSIEVQAGTYQEKGKNIFFNPETSQIGDLTSTEAEIINNCEIKWGQAGVFKAVNCQKSIPKKISHLNKFPKNWKIFKAKEYEIFAPVGSKITFKDNKLKIKFKNAYGEIFYSGNPDKDINKLLKKCNQSVLKKDNTYFLICGDGSYLEIVEKKGEKSLISYVKSKTFSNLKALSIAISSFKSALAKMNMPTFKKWIPNDSSFSIEIPEGWYVTGGTADFGANGYIRIVSTQSKDGKAGLIGVYYPFYGFMQTAYGQNGIPPMEPVNYVKLRFFQDLAQLYSITFDDLVFTQLNLDEEFSKKYTQQVNNLARSMQVQGLNNQFKFVYGKAKFTKEGKSFDMVIFGFISYLVIPLQGVGSSYYWGPSPLYICFTEKGKMNNWYPVLKKISESWQVNLEWLKGHLHKAQKEMQSTLKHYRKMSDMIHKNAEYRLNLGESTYNDISNTENEVFWDTFYALGGEERYDNPQTGEEIDVPIGADKYLYDNYSETWVGINLDQPDALDLINELKNNGFIELKKHTY